MGSPPTEFPELRFPREDPLRPLPYGEPLFRPAPPIADVRPRQPLARHIILFLLTAASTTYIGAMHWAGFLIGLSDRTVDLPWPTLLLHGCWYSVSILAILAAHEFGHYFACRYYGVDASLPYFIPLPIPPSGTLGAVIRIRQQFPSKRALFDIGVAGPIAGFVVLVPVLIAGIYMSQLVRLPADATGTIWLGEPLLYKLVRQIVFGAIPAGYDVNLHPMAFAAWVGMLVTALNLLPIGQLDGGHLSYSVFGRTSTVISYIGVASLAALATFWSQTWWAWTILTAGMLWMFGPHHPRVWDEHVPLDRTRLGLTVFAVLMFIACFMPAPFVFE